MRGNLKWADQPEISTRRSNRPNLKLIVNQPTQSEAETPGEKAIQSVSARAEVVLVLLAQGLLVLGLFMASNIVAS